MLIIKSGLSPEPSAYCFLHLESRETEERKD